jgi:hypothetical protein
MANAHVEFKIPRLERTQKKATSLITPPARVRFVHFDYQHNDIFTRRASSPTATRPEASPPPRGGCGSSSSRW